MKIYAHLLFSLLEYTPTYLALQTAHIRSCLNQAARTCASNSVPSSRLAPRPFQALPQCYLCHAYCHLKPGYCSSHARHAGYYATRQRLGGRVHPVHDLLIRSQGSLCVAAQASCLPRHPANVCQRTAAGPWMNKVAASCEGAAAWRATSCRHPLRDRARPPRPGRRSCRLPCSAREEYRPCSLHGGKPAPLQVPCACVQSESLPAGPLPGQCVALVAVIQKSELRRSDHVEGLKWMPARARTRAASGDERETAGCDELLCHSSCLHVVAKPDSRTALAHACPATALHPALGLCSVS
jgi:hypothetical protein